MERTILIISNISLLCFACAHNIFYHHPLSLSLSQSSLVCYVQFLCRVLSHLCSSFHQKIKLLGWVPCEFNTNLSLKTLRYHVAVLLGSDVWCAPRERIRVGIIRKKLFWSSSRKITLSCISSCQLTMQQCSSSLKLLTLCHIRII